MRVHFDFFNTLLVDKDAFARGFLDRPLTVTFPVSWRSPEAKFAAKLVNEWNEPQRGFLRDGNKWREVSGEELTGHLIATGNKRKKKYMGNGRGRKPVLKPNSEPVRIETFPMSSWDSELLNSHGAAVLPDLGREIAAVYEHLTGRRAIGLNWHLDTANYHADVVSVDTDDLLVPLASVIGKKGAWLVPTGAAIDLRYAADGFAVDPDVLAAEQANEARERKKPNCTSLRNLDVGLAADEWIRNWARSNGLQDVRLKLRKRYEEAALEKIDTIRSIKSAAQEVRHLTSRNSELEKQLRGAAGDLDSANAAARRACVQLEASRSEATTLRTQLASATKDLKSLQTEHEKLCAHLSKVEAARAHADSELIALKFEHVRTKDELDRLSAKMTLPHNQARKNARALIDAKTGESRGVARK